ncbi:MAG TPA: hypothetical protein VI318_20090 [Baekduia sp.]
MTDLFRSVAEQPESRALTRGLWVRRGVLALFAVVVVLALAGVAGQPGSTSRADAPAATVAVGMPDAVRGGLFFQAKVDIAARRDVEHPRLVLNSGWTEGMQVNSIEPGAESESSRDGRLVLSYDRLAAGDTMTIWFQFQVDPTQPGRRDFGLELDDAERPLARVPRTITVFP